MIWVTRISVVHWNMSEIVNLIQRFLKMWICFLKHIWESVYGFWRNSYFCLRISTFEKRTNLPDDKFSWMIHHVFMLVFWQIARLIWCHFTFVTVLESFLRIHLFVKTFPVIRKKHIQAKTFLEKQDTIHQLLPHQTAKTVKHLEGEKLYFSYQNKNNNQTFEKN